MKLKLNKEAKRSIEDGEPMPVGSSDGFWFDLTKGGYFNIEDVLEDPKQIKKMNEALELLQDLEEIYNQVVAEF